MFALLQNPCALRVRCPGSSTPRADWLRLRGLKRTEGMLLLLRFTPPNKSEEQMHV